MSEALKHEKEINGEGINHEDRVPFFQKIAYGFGVVSDHFANVSIVYLFFLPFFNDFLKVPAVIVTSALLLARGWDAITDPLVGSISDKWQSRFGRRKPFVIVGALLTGLFFPVIWLASPDWSQGIIVAYLITALLIFFTFYSIFSVPYESLGTELTPDYKERTNIFVVRSYVNQLGNLGLAWLFPLATWLALQPWVCGDVNGIRLVSILVAVIVIGTGILPGIFCKERYQKIAQEEAKKEQATFTEGFMALIKNTELMIVIGIICTYLLAIMSAGALGYYVNVYYIFDGDRFSGTVLGGVEGTLRVVYALIAAYMIKRIADKVDKHRLMIWCVITMLISLVVFYFTLIPGRPLFALVSKPLWAIGEVGFWILIISMRADVCDWDEYNTGRRREGIIAATTNWFTKVTMALAAVISGLLLQYAVGLDNDLNDEKKVQVEQRAQIEFDAMSEEERVGKKAEDHVFMRMFKAFPNDDSGRSWEMRVTDAMFNEGDEPEITATLLKSQMEQETIMEQQDDGMLWRMRFFYILPKFIALVIALILLQKYKLTREKMLQIRTELEERRGRAVAE